MTALLHAPGKGKRSECRNQMLLILGYDVGLRVGELVNLKVKNLHLDAETPYIRILGKGGKYRGVPLMKKPVQHLWNYLMEYHKCLPEPAMPLFYAVTHGKKHGLSIILYPTDARSRKYFYYIRILCFCDSGYVS